MERKLKPRDAMRLYGVALGVLFLFYLMGLFLGRNQFVEARPKEAALAVEDSSLESRPPDLDFYRTLTGPSLAESDRAVSPEAVSGASLPEEENLMSGEPSAILPLEVYTVQVGAFTAQVDARQILIRLEARGYSSVLMSPSETDPFYRVSVGEFSTNQEALRMEDKLGKDGFLTYVKKIPASSAVQ
ncbi:MAG: SPOR domain-containing protein [Acidobacteriota bacterium]